ncbi:hypothetical protein [Pseudomonas sp. RIT-PI-AD]|uniref:hypothetical protein n=1 Tax=Pseudomonas sp. RIT-PI-AD TaxID=3035294 RepID=UPI0021D90130|nr:hypothetical protein [Pseudomonas sp. RIT-PI-AD]
MSESALKSKVYNLLEELKSSSNEGEYIALEVYDENSKLFEEKKIKSLLSLLKSFCLDRMSESSMRFYIWYDALVGQLRVGVMRSIQEKPPFKCKINTNATLEDVFIDIHSEVSSLYKTGILDVCIL